MSSTRGGSVAFVLQAVTLLACLNLPVWGSGLPFRLQACALIATAAMQVRMPALFRQIPGWAALILLGAAPLVAIAHGGRFSGGDLAWLITVAWSVLLWSRLHLLASRDAGRVLRLAAPLLFGTAVLWLWQVLATGFEVPAVLLPSPAQVGHVLASRMDVLWPDFRQTFLKAVLGGYAAGSLAGFLVAVVADRIAFLRNGLLPLCRLVSSMPIVGIAPILVMWFGFDWESKAAVAAVVTFFPMLVNTLAGLSTVDPLQRDLMFSYAAGTRARFFKLQLPTALPFIFNALKINTTLALISAIVAEFFGSPILGLGFRISAEIARMNVDVVWAVIALAAVSGSAFYGLVALVERSFTFWHPSYRSR